MKDIGVRRHRVYSINRNCVINCIFKSGYNTYFKKAFNLPVGYEIIDCWYSNVRFAFCFTISHPSFCEVLDGEEAPVYVYKINK